MPEVENPQVFNIDIFYILLTLIYLIVYGGISTVLFFYFKNKYKNDEFRRLKPKQFIKKAIIGLLGSYIIIFLITSIILRVTDFANAIVVYNPLDAFIIVTGVISLIAIGYFIFSLFKASKAAKERKKAIKLKLADDVLDDGTK